MTIRHLRIFMAVCEHGGNVTKAAASLHMSQPAVSLAIRELETYYGVQLFERNGRHLKIAEAGRRLAAYAVSITGTFDDMEETMRSWETSGPLHVGASITIGSQFLPSYVSAFSARYPDSQVKAMVAPGALLEEKVLMNELDFALVEGAVHDSAFVSRRYMQDRLAMIVRPSARHLNRSVITLEEFRAMPFLLREKGSGTREVFDNAVEKAGFSVEPVWEAYSTTALLKAAEQGLGAAVLPYRMVVPALQSGRVIELVPEELDFTRSFHIIYQKHKHLTAAARNFIQLCIDYEMDYPLIHHSALE